MAKQYVRKPANPRLIITKPRSTKKSEDVRKLVEAVKAQRYGAGLVKALAEMVEVYWCDGDDGMDPPGVVARAATALRRKLREDGGYR